jgi:hypothetical protein
MRLPHDRGPTTSMAGSSAAAPLLAVSLTSPSRSHRNALWKHGERKHDAVHVVMRK